MFLADYHIHSTCSPDAKFAMDEMACAAAEKGMTHVCMTDHCDFDIPDTMQLGPDEFTLPRKQGHQFIMALEKAPEGLDIRLGLELGEGNHDPARAVRVYTMPEYDFILGALHNLRNTEDFYYLKYTSAEQCRELYERYLDELIDYAGIACFDVMAHIGYCLRYMHKQGQDIMLTMENNGDKIDTLLHTLIENGRGIELNCADLVPGGRSNPLLMTFPSISILRRYRELGGEIITVGSDAHSLPAAGLGIAEGYEILRENGFRYVSIFRHHKPEFIRI